LLIIVLKCSTIEDVSKKYQRTLALIFEKPDKKDIDWDDFIRLLVFLGALIRHQGGSAYGIRLNGEYAVFHKPHPGHTLYQADLKRIRKFLSNAGIKEVE
jgi:hypothetical protein